MAIFVHILEQAKDDSNRHGIGEARLSQFAAKIEETQLLESFERNNPYPCLVKKQFFGRDKRLVAMQATVGDDTLILFLRVLIRGSAEYADNFEGTASSESTLQYLDNQLRKELSGETLQRIVEARKQTDPPPTLPDVSAEEETFLWSPAYPGVEDDTMVCESHEFVEDLCKPELKNQLVRLPEMIIDAISSDAHQVLVITCVHNRHLALVVYNSPRTDQCVLLRLLHSSTTEQLQEIRNEWSAKIRDSDHSTILRYCRVSYPSLLCGDEQMWVSIHDGSEGTDSIANLALSPEEGDILNSCDLHEGDRSGFPLFINGRAGSGKSTLLQYLFAFSFRRWLATIGRAGNGETCPLYMASSKTLLTIAHRASDRILSLNSSRLLEGESFDYAARSALSNCFRQTYEFMHSHLRPEDRSRFAKDKRIDYTAFRRRWEQQFGKEPRARRDFGPQISWHIIRGLIKGFSPAALLEGDEFDDLPKEERSVSKETYQRVYDRVWLKWYRALCSAEKCWDDQDLVRHLLETDLLPRTHVAVFCDEAQDFTRLELESLYRCSLFSNRTLASHNIKRIPLAFAGDPFQTLNPTGFRWESVQAGFTERIVEALHRFNRQQAIPGLHYEELTYNYRSAKRIVHFCNSIQALRALLFDHRQLQPQFTWRIQDEENAPVFLDIADVQVRQDLREQSDLVLVVPCEEGEEPEFVAGDEFLKAIVELDEEGIPLNVQSASRSKGLEFRRVALYGWSNRPEAMRISQLVKGNATATVGVDEKLQLEYFMNNLYVAASRAQRRLFVLDDEASLESFWCFAHDEEQLQILVSNLPESWTSRVGTMVNGGSESFRHDKDTNRRLAEQLKEDGLARQAAFTLKQAAQYYDLDKNPVEANRCRGHAFFFAQRFEKSADHFESAGDEREAVRALWQGRLFQLLTNFVQRHPSLANTPECQAAIVLSDQEVTSRECLELFRNLSTAAGRDASFARALRDPLWSDAIERAVKSSVASAQQQSTPDVESDLIADQLDELLKRGLEIEKSVLADLHFTAGNYENVVNLLADEQSSEVFRDAKALSLLRLADSGQPIEASDATLVGDFLMRQQPPNPVRASKCFLQSGEHKRQIECLRRTIDLEGINDDELAAVVHDSLCGSLRYRDWANLVSILRHGRPKETGAAQTKRNRGATVRRVLKIIDDRGFQWNLVIPRLAEAAELSDDSGQEKQQVQEYLKGLLGNQEWRRYIHPRILGAAIERAGKDIDALVFYENMTDHEGDSKERLYAQARWVVCKLRQADRQNSATNRREAQRVLDKYGWEESALGDDYPDIERLVAVGATELAPSAAPQSRSQTQALGSHLRDRETKRLGELEFKLLSSKGWVNIEAEDGLRARVLLDEKSIDSSDIEFEPVDASTYRCVEWSLEVVWTPDAIVRFLHPDGVLVAARAEKSERR